MKNLTTNLTPAVIEFQNNIEAIRKYYSIKDRNKAGSLKKVKNLLKKSQSLHDRVIEDFNTQKEFDRVKAAQACGLMAVKTIRINVEDKKNDHLEFIFNQIINPQKTRPVKAISSDKDKKADRNTVFRSDTLTIETRNMDQERGREKATAFSKAMSFTLAVCPSLTHTYNYNFSVMLMIDLRYTILKPYQIYSGNMATNQKWHIKDSKSWNKVMNDQERHAASTLSKITQTQLHNISNGTTSPQNELLPRVSASAVLGIMAVAKRQVQSSKTGYVYVETEVSDRLNALYANYTFRQLAHKHPVYKNFIELWQNFPTYILEPGSSEIFEYSISEQIADLKIALSRDENTIAHARVKKLREDITDTTVFSPAIKLFLDMQESSASALDIKNIMAAHQNGFPKEEFTSLQLDKLYQNIGTTEEKLTYIQDPKSLQHFISNKKVGLDEIIDLIKNPQFDDSQRQRILSAVIANGETSFIFPILKEVKDDSVIFKTFLRFKYDMELRDAFLLLLEKRGQRCFHEIVPGLVANFPDVVRICQQLMILGKLDTLQMISLYLFSIRIAPLNANMIMMMQTMTRSELTQVEQDNLVKVFLNGITRPKDIHAFFIQLVDKFSDIKNNGKSIINLMSHLNSSGSGTVSRHQAADLICKLIDKVSNIQTLLEMVETLELPENQLRWQFIQKRQSLIRLNSYSYTCHGHEVSEPWIQIMSYAQDKILSLAKFNQPDSVEKGKVIKFLNKPTWKTGFFDSFFSAPNKARQYEKLIEQTDEIRRPGVEF